MKLLSVVAYVHIHIHLVINFLRVKFCSTGLGRTKKNGAFSKFIIFRLDALALSVIATATWLAGWLGGWVSVTLRYCIKMAKPIGKLFRPPESPIILVF